MKIIHALQRRHASKKVPSYTKYLILVENLEELVNLSIQEIIQLLDQLGPEYPTTQYPPWYPPRVMAAANQPTWRDKTPLNLVAPLHDFPKHPNRALPKLDPRKGISEEDHLNFFYLALEL